MVPEMKKILFVVLIFIASSVSARTLPEVSSFSQQQIFKSWVQNRCIGKITKNSALIKDANASAAAWLEFSTLPVEKFEKADAIIDNELQEKIGGSVNSPYQVLKCTLIAESDRVQNVFTDSKQ